jgi:hypothetical protein
MRNTRRNADHVTRGDRPANASFDVAVPFLVRTDCLAIEETSPEQQCCGAGLDKKYVGLGLVPFHLPIRFAVNEQIAVIRVIGKLADGELVRIGGRFSGHFFKVGLQRAGSPQLEPGGRLLLRQQGKTRDEQKQQNQSRPISEPASCGRHGQGRIEKRPA